MNWVVFSLGYDGLEGVTVGTYPIHNQADFNLYINPSTIKGSSDVPWIGGRYGDTRQGYEDQLFSLLNIPIVYC